MEALYIGIGLMAGVGLYQTLRGSLQLTLQLLRQHRNRPKLQSRLQQSANQLPFNRLETLYGQRNPYVSTGYLPETKLSEFLPKENGSPGSSEKLYPFPSVNPDTLTQSPELNTGIQMQSGMEDVQLDSSNSIKPHGSGMPGLMLASGMSPLLMPSQLELPINMISTEGMKDGINGVANHSSYQMRLL